MENARAILSQAGCAGFSDVKYTIKARHVYKCVSCSLQLGVDELAVRYILTMK